MNIPFFKSSRSKKIKEIDILLDRLRKIADAIEPVDKMMCEFDTTIRDLLRLTKFIEANEEFIKLDRLKVLSEDDGCGDAGMPYLALCKSLRKINEDDNPVSYPCEVYSRIYGLILELEEYKKYCK